MSEDETDPAEASESSNRARAWVPLCGAVVLSVYVIATDSSTLWPLVAVLAAGGLFQLAMAPVHGEAARWAMRRHDERRRRIEDSEGGP